MTHALLSNYILYRASKSHEILLVPKKMSNNTVTSLSSIVLCLTAMSQHWHVFGGSYQNLVRIRLPTDNTIVKCKSAHHTMFKAKSQYIFQNYAKYQKSPSII